MPKLKFFYFFLATVVALSRVIVGAHYFTDILGGILVAIMGYKITLFLFKKYNKEKYLKKIDVLDSNLIFLSFIVFIILTIFLAIGKSADVYISSLFYYGDKQFVLQSFYTITIIARKVLLPLIILYLLLLPIASYLFSLKLIYFNYIFKFKDIVFIYCCIFLNLIVVVNVMLKNFWGRARPNDIQELGGNEFFTPWYIPSNNCLTNCSFVSGDAAVGFSLIILYFLTKNNFYFWIALFAGLGLGFIRILEGGHFLSDVLMSGLIIFLLSFIQINFYKKIKFYE